MFNVGPIFEWRGAGTLSEFYVGAWLGIKKYLHPDSWRFIGISGGAVMSTLAICRFDVVKITNIFNQLSLLEYKRYRETGINSVIIAECKSKYNTTMKMLNYLITDDLVSKYCSKGKLTILAFDLLSLKVVSKSEWKNAKELINWISASISILITSNPKYLDGKLLVDCFNFDVLTKYQSTNESRLLFSPIEEESKYSHIKPSKPLPAILSIVPHSDEMKSYLINEGFISTAKFLHIYYSKCRFLLFLISLNRALSGKS